MAEPIIRVERLGKKYRISHQQTQRYTALRDVLAENAARFVRRPFEICRRFINTFRRSSLRPPADIEVPDGLASNEDFWALRDVSFEVNQGDVVGIIGRNGAGKSTLLKLLSRITEPTEGCISLRGRVASLLEVGTGFHPELTGRENIFLNGAILGMTKAEIRSKFDEIVSFAEVEKFLDTPVKRYSSGMYVRLAFAVAAHLEPEILVVDEVLAVGDADFQKKCLARMSKVADAGRTVLFVSHNMQAVQALCSRGIVLDRGQTLLVGDTISSIKQYLDSTARKSDSRWVRNSRSSQSPLQIEAVQCQLMGTHPSFDLAVDVTLRSTERHAPAFVAIDILGTLGVAIMQAVPVIHGFLESRMTNHNVRVIISLPKLIPAIYTLTVWVGPHNTITYDEIRNCVSFETTESPTHGRTVPHTPDHGFIVPDSKIERT